MISPGFHGGLSVMSPVDFPILLKMARQKSSRGVRRKRLRIKTQSETKRATGSVGCTSAFLLSFHGLYCF